MRNMKKVVIVVIVVIVMILCGCSNNMPLKNSGGENVRGAVTKENLKKDIVVLKNKLPRCHNNLFHKISKEEFNKDIDKLYEKADKLDEAETYYEMVKIVAKIGDGHTAMTSMPTNFRYLPIMTRVFSDGIYITHAKGKYESLIGRKIAKAGDARIEEVVDKMGELIPHENDYWVRENFPAYFSVFEALHYLKVTEKEKVILEMSDGEKIEIEPKKAEEFNDYGEWSSYFNKYKTKKSLSDKKKEENYWYEYKKDFNALYFQYNSCSERQDFSFKKFCSKMFEKIDENNVKNIIVDIRHNSGGNSGLFTVYFLPELKKREKLKVFYITGRETFSSGMFAIRDLREIKGSVSFGEPTGNSPNHYGFTGVIKLPNTGIYLSYSREYWKIFDTESNTFIPENVIEVKSEDYFNGVDRVTETIFDRIKKS